MGQINSNQIDRIQVKSGVSLKNSPEDINSSAFPHQFSLQDTSTKSHICSVTLIHPLLLLTAAHCVFGRRLGGLRAVTGNHHHLDPANSNVTEEQSRGIIEAILHPKFDSVTMENDIALLRLDRPAPTSYNGSAIVAPLPQPNWTHFDEGILIGRGIKDASTEVDGTPAEGAFEADSIPIEERSVCADDNNPGNRNVTVNMLCAGYSGNDSCNEIQTAAVLMCGREESGKLFICGIGSWGNDCGWEPETMIYTKVSKYRSWISKEMRKIRRA